MKALLLPTFLAALGVAGLLPAAPGDLAPTTSLVPPAVAPLSSAPTVVSTPSGPALTEQQIERVVTMLASPDGGQRQIAYKACRARGDGFRYSYFQMLMRAEFLHGVELKRQVKGLIGPSTPVGETLGKWKAWKTAADTARPFILTDHHKDQAKFQEMDRLYLAADETWQSYVKQDKKFTKAGDTVGKLDSAAAALREIHVEKAYCQPDQFDAKDLPDLQALEEDLNLGEEITEFLRARTEMAALRELISQVAKANEAAAWASGPQKAFVALLNQRRVTVGCRPLLIEQKLSEAATDHSKEMIAMGYFAHESPVEANKTPWKRAANAKFAGNASGECIFAGSPDPAAAEKAWWYSDGHRLINYSTGPNVIGMGPVGGHWTLMTGNLNDSQGK